MFGDRTRPARVSPTAASLDAITPEALAEFHRTRYVPGSRGDRLCRRHLAGRSAQAGRGEARRLEEGGRRQDSRLTDPPPTRPAEGVPRRAVQARCRRRLYVGTQSMKRTDPDYAALTVANRVLGGTMGRLVPAPARGEGIHLRHRQRLLRDAVPRRLDGIDERADRGDRAGADRPAGGDRRAARQARPGQRVRRLRSARSSAALRCRWRTRSRCSATTSRTGMYGLPADYWDTYPARVSAVTAAQAQAAAANTGPRPACTSSPSAMRRRSPTSCGRRASCRRSIPDGQPIQTAATGR